jgi:hypothetical protein
MVQGSTFSLFLHRSVLHGVSVLQPHRIISKIYPGAGFVPSSNAVGLIDLLSIDLGLHQVIVTAPPENGPFFFFFFTYLTKASAVVGSEDRFREDL